MMMMAKWQSEVFQGEIPQRIQSEYRKLLAIGKNEDEAELLLLTSCWNDITPDSIEEGRMWCAMALKEWELGRLSNKAQTAALKWIKLGGLYAHESTTINLQQTLKSPMPARKNIPKPRTRRCPWKVGSLLAYRIVTNPQNVESRFFGKYVLLRVVKHIHWPYCYLAPEQYFSDSMLVGLYKWVGDQIPDPSIVNELEYTPIRISKPFLSEELLQKVLSVQEIEIEDTQKKAVLNASKSRVETCYSLDWGKTSDGPGEIHLLDIDPTFEKEIPDFFQTNLTGYSLGTILPFDTTLIKRLEELFGK